MDHAFGALTKANMGCIYSCVIFLGFHNVVIHDPLEFI